jgi:hypothetical protein
LIDFGVGVGLELEEKLNEDGLNQTAGAALLVELMTLELKEDVTKLRDLGHGAYKGLELARVGAMFKGVDVATGRACAGPGTSCGHERPPGHIGIV